jgi:hypothetical protein
MASTSELVEAIERDGYERLLGPSYLAKRMPRKLALPE